MVYKMTLRHVTENDFNSIYNLYESYRQWQQNTSSQYKKENNRYLSSDELKRIWQGEMIRFPTISNVVYYDNILRNVKGYCYETNGNILAYTQWNIVNNNATNELILYNFGTQDGRNQIEDLVRYSFQELNKLGIKTVNGRMSSFMFRSDEFNWLKTYSSSQIEEDSRDIYYNIVNTIDNLLEL